MQEFEATVSFSFFLSHLYLLLVDGPPPGGRPDPPAEPTGGPALPGRPPHRQGWLRGSLPREEEQRR